MTTNMNMNDCLYKSIPSIGIKVNKSKSIHINKKTNLNINDLMIVFIIYYMNICSSICTNVYVYTYAYIKTGIYFLY